MIHSYVCTSLCTTGSWYMLGHTRGSSSISARSDEMTARPQALLPFVCPLLQLSMKKAGCKQCQLPLVPAVCGAALLAD